MNTIVTPPKGLPDISALTTAQPGEVRTPDASYFTALQTEVNDKGFLVTSTEDLFQWARTGSVVDDLWSRVLRGGDDPRQYAAL